MVHLSGQRQCRRGIYARNVHRGDGVLRVLHHRYNYQLLTSISQQQDQQLRHYLSDP